MRVPSSTGNPMCACPPLLKSLCARAHLYWKPYMRVPSSTENSKCACPALLETLYAREQLYWKPYVRVSSSTGNPICACPALLETLFATLYFKLERQEYFQPDKDRRTIVNDTCLSKNGGSLESTFTASIFKHNKYST